MAGGWTREVMQEQADETTEAVEWMRKAGMDWPAIARYFGIKQASLASKFRDWRALGLTTLHVPDDRVWKPGRFNSAAALELLTLIGFRTGWWQHAACAKPGVDRDAFHVKEGGSNRPGKEICNRCPVVAQCLEYALEHDEREGVWGGLSPEERKALRSSPEWRQGHAA